MVNKSIKVGDKPTKRLDETWVILGLIMFSWVSFTLGFGLFLSMLA